MTSKTDLQDSIHAVIKQVASESGKQIIELDDDTVLLESGLDSLDFAIIVARLERELGYDPFSLLDRPVYPRTFRDFVDIYLESLSAS